MDTSVILYIFIALTAILIGWIIRLEIKLSRLLSGQNGKSLEGSIVSLLERTSTLESSEKNAHEKIAELRARLKRTVQNVRTLRFNPFKGTGAGGNQSFVTALSDENGDGVVISGLYARAGVSVYAKPLANFSSEIQLSEEEKEVVEKLKS